jgi:hypothetical protein
MNSIYSILLYLQSSLANCVTPELRAITLDVDIKKSVRIVRFFYDAEITGELEDRVSTLMIEVESSFEVIQLDSSKSIPIQGKRLAYLRYEETLPKFERDNESRAFLLKEGFVDNAIFRLDMQQALLGRITPVLRHVSVAANPSKKQLISHFIYGGKISEFNYELASAAIQDSRVSFADYEMEPFIERVDYPNEMTHRGQCLAYWRQEWIYKNNERMAAIRYA